MKVDGGEQEEQPAGRTSSRTELSTILWSAVSKDYAGGVLAVITLYFGVGLIHPEFLGLDRVANVLNQAAFVGILAIGVAVLLAMRHVDLSVGSIYGASTMVAALLATHIGVPLALVCAVLLGGVCGLINGLVIRLLALPSIVVTLATAQVFRGFTIAVSDGRQKRGPDLDTWFPELVVTKPLGIPFTAWTLAALTLLLTFVMGRTVFGYRVRSIGSNPEAARFAGLPTARTELTGFVLMGLLAGVAGALALGFFGAADPNNGVGFELRAIAAAVIGGTSLRGGRLTVVGAAVGAIVLALISSALAQFKVPLIWNAFATGLAILAAISIDSLFRRSVNRAARGHSELHTT